MPIPNQQWKWIIVDIEDGSTVGSDDDKVAAEFALSENFIVIERNTCQVYSGYDVEKDENNDYVPDVENIAEQRTYQF